jgi:predicted dehydrogenase
MIRVGVVGKASIFQKKWQHAIESNPQFKLIGIARRKLDDFSDNTIEREGYFSFKKGEIDLAYIPLPNSLHYEIAKYYLLQSVNVVIEKPATLSFEETSELIDIANRNNVFFIEGFQWRYHTRTKYLIELLKNQRIHFVDVFFTVPHFKTDNIRYSKQLGGGATSDLGAYPISVISTLFQEEKFDLANFELFYDTQHEVDLGGLGHFKSNSNIFLRFFYRIGMQYDSRLFIYTDNGRYELNQPFTIGPDTKAIIRHEHNLIVNDFEFLDCHFKSFLHYLLSGFDFKKENERTIVQARYHAMLLNRLI